MNIHIVFTKFPCRVHVIHTYQTLLTTLILEDISVLHYKEKEFQWGKILKLYTMVKRS